MGGLRGGHMEGSWESGLGGLGAIQRLIPNSTSEIVNSVKMVIKNKHTKFEIIIIFFPIRPIKHLLSRF